METPIARKRRALRIVITALGLVAVVWGTNYVLIGYPVAKSLTSDQNYSLEARFEWYLNPNTLVLNLTRADRVAPMDLFQAILQSAEAMRDRNWTFSRVVLARAWEVVFVIDGADFNTIGAAVSRGEDLWRIIRALPEILRKPSGELAFEQWQGHWVAVMAEQMEDANTAARRWAAGP